jgi:hypothetical protein
LHLAITFADDRLRTRGARPIRIDLKDARWFGRERAVGYAKVIAIAFIPPLFWMYQQAMGPVGSDFVQFWAASKLLLAGDPAAAYIPAKLSAVQFALGRDHWFPFLCTPPFLAVIAPLALVPYSLAWPVWVLTTYALWLSVARRLIPQGFWPIAIYPGAMIAAWHAQNGFVTGALFVGAVLALPKRTILAGALLGALVIKPHLAILVPVALLAGRRWRAFAAAGASAAGLLLLSWAAFGTETMRAYLFASGLGPGVLRPTDPDMLLRMPTVYAGVAVHAGPVAAAWAQGAMTAAMIALVWRTWSKPGDDLGKCAVLAVATVLATPYLFHYDLTILIVPVCWMALEGMKTGFRPWERVMLVVFYWMPLVGRAFSAPLGVNLTPITLLVFLYFAHQRLRATGDRSRPRAPEFSW